MVTKKYLTKIEIYYIVLECAVFCFKFNETGLWPELITKKFARNYWSF